MELTTEDTTPVVMLSTSIARMTELPGTELVGRMVEADPEAIGVAPESTALTKRGLAT
jgi:hypothetical protein